MNASYFRCDRLPVSVRFISTYICNIICEHCDIWRFRGEELSTGEVKAMVRELREIGTRSLKFDGGEPLTRPDIGALLTFCREQGIETSLCSNGLLVERNLSKLESLGQLVVSLSWTDGYTERVLLYEKSLKAVEAAKMAGINVAASITLTRSNISALPAILADGAALGVRMKFRRLLRHGHSMDNSRFASICPDIFELEGALRFLFERKRMGAAIDIPFSKDTSAESCISEESSFVITPSGDVAPCYRLYSFKKWPNGRWLGFRAAFRKAGEFYCPSEVFT
ncbi:MAG: radical SAM protein [Deltaproteobacteria bacterium]|nr:radical SAM protein [Deltaproteobacteria bacterium]